MVCDDTDSSPIQRSTRAADTIEEGVDLGIYLTNKESIERMPQGVELAGLGPAAALGFRHFGLILIKNLDAGTRHHVAQPRGIR